MGSTGNVAVLLLAVTLASPIWTGCGSKARSKGGAAADPNSVGIHECDDYLLKYSRCVEAKVPAEQRKVHADSVSRMRAAWKAMASEPGVRPGLGQSCSLALETARSSMEQYGCQW
jgi:hypothetical protein